MKLKLYLIACLAATVMAVGAAPRAQEPADAQDWAVCIRGPDDGHHETAEGHRPLRSRADKRVVCSAAARAVVFVRRRLAAFPEKARETARKERSRGLGAGRGLEKSLLRSLRRTWHAVIYGAVRGES